MTVSAALVAFGTRAAFAYENLPELTVTASPFGVGAADTASQGQVTQQRLQDFPVYRPAEILETVPGLVITEHSGEGKANQYFLRGFNLDHGTDIDIMLDGMPVNLRTHAHGQGYADLNFMIPELVRVIDYSKGPYFAEKGDFDTAGAVDIYYVDSLPQDLVSISAGTLAGYRGLSAVSRPWQAGTILLATEYDHVDGPWVIPDNYNKGNLVLRYSQGSQPNGFAVTGMAMVDQWHASNQIPLRAVQEGLISPFGTIDPTDAGRSQRYSLSGHYADTDQWRQIKANAYVIGETLTLFNDFDYFLQFPTPEMGGAFPGQFGDQFVQSERRGIVGGAASYTAFGTLLGRDSSNTFGFDTRTDNIHLELAETTARVVTGTVRDDHVIESSGGIYVENRTQWLDMLRTVIGLREDLYYGSDSSTPIVANSGTTAKGMLSPKLNVVLGPWQQSELYLSYGQGFHSNDLRGALTTVNVLQTELNPPGSQPVAQARTPLLTKAEGYEIGVRSQALPKVSASAALFVLDLASEATFNGDQAITTAGRPSRRTGLELSAGYNPLAWLSLNGDFAFTRARFTDFDPVGNLVPEAAKIIAGAEIAVHDLSGWDGSLRFRYFGPRPLIEDGTVRSGPTALFDARIGYQLSERFHVSVDIFNLFNSRAHQIDYFYPSLLASEVVPGTQPQTGHPDIHFKQVEPTSARFTLTMAF